MTRDTTRETLAMTREDSDSRLMTRDSTRDSTVMTRAQLCRNTGSTRNAIGVCVCVTAEPEYKIQGNSNFNMYS